MKLTDKNFCVLRELRRVLSGRYVGADETMRRVYIKKMMEVDTASKQIIKSL